MCLSYESSELDKPEGIMETRRGNTVIITKGKPIEAMSVGLKELMDKQAKRKATGYSSLERDLDNLFGLSK
jgi:hypothetical protein